MADKKSAQADPKPMQEPKKPQRVKVKNAKRSNGPIGVIARPLAKDVDVWLAKGWVKD